jgi:hypothetical protein
MDFIAALVQQALHTTSAWHKCIAMAIVVGLYPMLCTCMVGTVCHTAGGWQPQQGTGANHGLVWSQVGWVVSHMCSSHQVEEGSLSKAQVG